MSLPIAVDSPPGMIRPLNSVELVGRANSDASYVQRLEHHDMFADCSPEAQERRSYATSPVPASAPSQGCRDVDTDHRLAQIAAKRGR